MIIVHSIAKPPAAEDSAGVASVVCRRLGPNEPIPQGAIWIDLVEPAMEEDQRVQEFVGAPVPTKADPDYTEPPEAHYSENGVRYLHALFISEPDDTPDVTGVTFVVCPTTLVTVRYHPVESFDLFSQKLCRSPGQALFPDAVAVGLINTALNRSARAPTKAGESLDRIASAVFRAKGDQSSRNQIYSDTLSNTNERGHQHNIDASGGAAVSCLGHGHPYVIARSAVSSTRWPTLTPPSSPPRRPSASPTAWSRTRLKGSTGSISSAAAPRRSRRR